MEEVIREYRKYPNNTEKISLFINQLNSILQDNDIIKEYAIRDSNIDHFILFYTYNDINLNILKYTHEYISSFKCNFFDKEVQLKYFLILIYYNFFFKKTDKLSMEKTSFINRIIAQLFDKYFSIKEIIIIAKFWLILASYTQSHKSKSANREGKSIANMCYIKLSFELIENAYKTKHNNVIKENEAKWIIDYICFFEKFILSNLNNIRLLSNVLNSFPLMLLIKKQRLQLNNPLLKELSSKINQISIVIFKDQFKGSLMKDLVNGFKTVIVNHKQTVMSYHNLMGDLLYADHQIDYIKNCQQIEYQTNQKNPYDFQSGFYFNDNGKSLNGIKISIDELKAITIIFGLKYFPMKDKERMGLLAFYSDKSDPLFAFIIERDNLYIETYGQIKDTNPIHLLMKIEPLTSYVLLLQIEISKKCKEVVIKLITNGGKDIIDYKFPSPIASGSKVDCTIGIAIPKEDQVTVTFTKEKNKDKTINNTLKSFLKFRGEIGTVIFFSDFLSEDNKKYLLMLKGDYLHCLLYQKFDLSCIVKYFNNEVMQSKRHITAVEHFIYIDKKLINLLICIISPESCQLNLKGNYGKIDNAAIDKRFPETIILQWNYLGIEENNLVNQKLKVNLLSPLSDSFMVYHSRLTLLEFLKFDGLNFLSLHLEYYNQLLEDNIIPSKNKKEIIDKIYTNIDNLLLLFFFILDKTNIEDFQSGKMTIFYMISTILDKLTTYRKLKNGPIFITLFNIFISLKLAIQLMMDNVKKNTNTNSSNSSIQSIISNNNSFHNQEYNIKCVHFDPDDICNQKIIALLRLRSQITYMLLNDQLYDIDDNTSIYFLFEVISNILTQFPDKSLLNPLMIRRILCFSNKYQSGKYSSDLINITTNSYFKLLSIFFKIEQENTNFNVLCQFIYDTNNHIDVFYFFIQLLLFNENLVNSFKNVKTMNILLKDKIKEGDNKKLDERLFILVIMLYIEININTDSNVMNKETLDQIDSTITKLNEIPHFLIKLRLLSLYKNQLSNEEKFKCIYEKKPLPSLSNTFNCEQVIISELISTCIMILQQLSSEKNEIFIQSYTILIEFIEKTLSLPESNPFFIYFYHKDNKSIMELFIVAVKLNFDFSKTHLMVLNHIISCHADPFIFDFLFLINRKNNYSALILKSFTEIIMRLMEIDENNLNHKYLIYNLVNLTMGFYEDIIENQTTQTIFMNCEYRKLFFSLVKLLENTGILYLKTLFSIKLSFKLLSEIVFEIFIKLIGTTYKVITDIEPTEERNTLSLFESSFIKKKQNKTESIFFYSDFQMVEHILHSDSKKTSIPLKIIEEKYFAEKSNLKCNYTIYFLKFILHEYFKRVGESQIFNEPDVLTEKLLYISQIIYNDIINLIKLSSLKKNYIIKDSSYYIGRDYKKILNHFNNYKTLSFNDLLGEYMKNAEGKENSEAGSRKDSNQDKTFSIKGSLLFDSRNSSKNDFRPNSMQANPLAFRKQFTLKEKIIQEVNKEEDEEDKNFIIDFRHVLFKGTFINPRNYFLLQHFGMYFKDILFYDEVFVKMKEFYLKNRTINPSTKVLQFPSKRKRFSIGTLPPVFLKQDQDFFHSKYFIVSHKYYLHIIEKEKCNLKQITFSKHHIHLADHQKSLHSFQCELIIYGSAYFGLLEVYDQYIIFNTQNEGKERKLYDNSDMKYIYTSLALDRSKDTKHKLIYFKDIKEIISKEFVQIRLAIEIYLKNGKSFFFNILLQEQLNALFKILEPISNKFQWKLVTDCKKEFKKEQYPKKWREKTITPYDYIFTLNKYSSRSFNDTNQYFIFPWIITSYPKDQIFNFPLKDNNILRKFGRVISLQNDEKYQNKIIHLKEKIQDFWNPSKFGGQYSASAFVFYYLMRINPFTQELIKLQNMNQENVNRMFNSFREILHILTNSEDNREVSPEFFCSLEYMLNLNCNLFGSREKFDIDDLYFSKNNSLSEFAQGAVNFWKLLNRPEITELLHLWIDLVFGVNQQCKPNQLVEFVNKYDSLIKELQQGDIDIEKQSYLQKKIRNILNEISDVIQTSINFGQPPSKLFSKSHPIYAYNSSTITDFEMNMNTNSNDSTGMIGNSLNRLCQINNKAHVYFITTINHYLIILNIKRIIEVYDIENFGDKKKVIEIQLKKFKLFGKIFPEDKKNYSHILKEKYAFAILNSDLDANEWIFIVGRHQDHSIKLYQYIPKKNSLLDEFLIEDFVCCVAIVEHLTFIIGLRNGKLIECECIQLKDDMRRYTIHQKKYVIAHEADINVIEVKKEIGIVITAGSDNYIYIRKLYDFELLTIIEGDSQYLITEIKLSPMNFLYTLCYHDKARKSVLKGYTLAGIHFASSPPLELITFYFSSSSNIMIGCYKEKTLVILSPSDFREQSKIKLGNSIMNNWFYAYDCRVILLETNLIIDIYKLSTGEMEEYLK